MKSIALLLVLFPGLPLYAVPAGATDLVPRSDSPAREKLKIPESDTTTTVTFKASPPADISAAKPAEENDLFGEGNVALPGAIVKSKPNVLEVLYGEVAKPLEPVGGGSPLVPTQEFFAAAKKVAIAIARDDQGKISGTDVNIAYDVRQTFDSFRISTIISMPAVEKMELKTRIIVTPNEWNVFGGSTRDAGGGTKRYFYWAIRINTELNKFPPGSIDG